MELAIEIATHARIFFFFFSECLSIKEWLGQVGVLSGRVVAVTAEVVISHAGRSGAAGADANEAVVLNLIGACSAKCPGELGQHLLVTKVLLGEGPLARVNNASLGPVLGLGLAFLHGLLILVA